MFVLLVQEGLLSCLTVVQSITLARNAFSSYPSGGPAQFASVTVSLLTYNASLPVHYTQRIQMDDIILFSTP